MPRCKHDKGNIQQFTEICLDCGHNIYETDAEYEASLRRDITSLRNELVSDRISKLEEEKEALERALGRRDDDDNSGGW